MQVKSLPFKGTGKHKYSFQRIEVPPLPIHFCDCDEHRGPSETASQKHLSSVNSGIHYEKELNIMNSVISKLFEKENNIEPPADIADPTPNDIDEGGSEETSEADDNLVTNIGMGRRDDMLMLLRDTMAASQVC